MTRNEKDQDREYDMNTSYASEQSKETPVQHSSFKYRKSEDQRLFSPSYNAYQTPTSTNDNDANNYDSCISLRPINLNNSSSEVCVVTNTTRFEAPKIDNMKTFAKQQNEEPELSFNVNHNSRLMKKSVNIHREILNKRKRQLEEFKQAKGDIEFYQLSDEPAKATTTPLETQVILIR